VGATGAIGLLTDIQEHQVRSGEADRIITLESEVLDETRDLWVNLPQDYYTELGRRILCYSSSMRARALWAFLIVLVPVMGPVAFAIVTPGLRR
jgi:hypothetical protein